MAPNLFFIFTLWQLVATATVAARQTGPGPAPEHQGGLFTGMNGSETNEHALQDPQYVRGVQSDVFAAGHADTAGLKVVFRQRMVDYGTAVGLELLQKHSTGFSTIIVEQDVDTHVPFGRVKIQISDVWWRIHLDPDCTAVEIDRRRFMASSCNINADLKYQWRWKSERFGVRDSGTAGGTAQFRDGNLELAFRITDDERVSLKVDGVEAAFDDITVTAQCTLGFIYKWLLQGFHSQVQNIIEFILNIYLKERLPKQLERFMNNLPSTVTITGLPVHAAFQYAFETNEYIFLEAWPEFGAQLSVPAPTDTAKLGYASMRPHEFVDVHDGNALAQALLRSSGQSLAAVAKDSEQASQEEGIREKSFNMGTDSNNVTGHRHLNHHHGAPGSHASLNTGQAVHVASSIDPLTGYMEADSACEDTGKSIRSTRPSDAHADGQLKQQGNVIGPGSSCPARVPFLVPRCELLHDSHMATVFLSDSEPQCLLHALHDAGSLGFCFDDRTVHIRGFEFTTTVFDLLVPGIARDYPGRSVAVCVESTGVPTVKFVASSGIHFQGSVEVSAVVLPAVRKASNSPSVEPSNIDFSAPKAKNSASRTIKAMPDIQEKAGAYAALYTSSKRGLFVRVYGEEVARLAANVSGVLDMHYEDSDLKELYSSFEVLSSKYHDTVDPREWEETFHWIADSLRHRLGVKQAWQSFVEEKIATKYKVVNTEGQFLDGWFQMSADFEVDLGPDNGDYDDCSG